MTEELIAMTFIILHTVDGRNIYLNPNDIVALVDVLDSGQRHYEGACIIQLEDGKSRGIAETCEQAKSILGETK